MHFSYTKLPQACGVTFCDNSSELSPLAFQHSELRFPSPSRQTSCEAQTIAPDEADYHCIVHGETIPQLGFWLPTIHKAQSVHVAISACLFGYQLQIRSRAGKSVEGRMELSLSIGTRRTWPIPSVCVIWCDLALQILLVHSRCAFGSSSANGGRDSIACRWEYRYDPYFDLESVRPFAIPHTCTHV